MVDVQVDALEDGEFEGFVQVTVVVVVVWQKEFECLSNMYRGQRYIVDSLNVISAGERDPDAEGVEGMSASKLRSLAADGDFDTFKKGLPKAAKGVVARELFNTVQRSMSKAAATEGVELWQIAPKYDQKTLREQYVTGNLFGMGSLVESLVTGLVGRVMRKGTNYVIAVTKEGIMFKSWIRDLTEYVSRIPSGVPAHKREVGTDSYREYVQKLTPLEKVKSFINKRKETVELSGSMKNFIEDSAESIMLNSMSNVFVTEKLDPIGQEDADIDNDGDSDSSDSYLRKRRKAVGAAIAADKAKRVKKEEMELALRQKVEGLTEKKLYKSEKATTSDEKETEITEKSIKNKVVINPDIAEACWKGYEKKGMKPMFGKRYPNCVKKTKKEEVELEEGIGDKLKSAAKAVKKGIEQENKLQRASGETLDRMKRMTRHKQDKYGPSTLKQRLKTGADHDIDAEKKAKGLKEGNKSGDSSLRDWFSKSKSSDGKPGWVQLGGKYAGKPCAKQPGQTTKPKCGSSKMKRNLNKDEEEAAFRRKQKEDPNPNRKGKAINVKTEATYPQDFKGGSGVAKKKKGRPNAQGDYGKKDLNERGDFWHPDPDKDRKLGGPGANQRAREDRAAASKPKSDPKKLRPGESYMEYAKRMKTRKEEVELTAEGKGEKDACYKKVKSRYSVWPSAYASGALVKCRKVGAANWGNKSKK